MITADRARHRRADAVPCFSAVRAVLTDYPVMIVGAAAYALSVSFFTSPNGIAPGGVTGIATMLNYLLLVPIGATALILNIPLFIWGVIENGTQFIFRTVIASASASLFIDLFSLIPVHYQGDRILAAVFGGILSGCGLGLIFLRGGSTGGTDIIGRNLHERFQYLSIGSVILMADAVVILLAAVVYSSIENALYAVITIFCSTKVIDAVVFGFSRDNGKLLIVITAASDRVSRALLTKADRGVTVLPARGGYSGEARSVILCAVHPRDAYRVRAVITDADPAAFIVTAPATAVSGLGFSSG